MHRLSLPGCFRRRTQDHGRSLKTELQSPGNAFGQNSTCPTPKVRQERQPRALESSVSLASKNTHLCGAAKSRVLRSDRQETNGIPKSVSYPTRPRLKFRTCPLKAMVFVPHLARGKGFKLDVVFDVRRRHHHRLRTSEFKQDALERRKTRPVLVLNDLHHSCSVVTS